MFGVKKRWTSWHAFSVFIMTLGLCVPAGAVSTDHSHGGHNMGNVAVDNRRGWKSLKTSSNMKT